MKISIQKLLRLGIIILWISTNIAAFLSDNNIYVNVTSVATANVIFLTYFTLAANVNISVVIYNIIGLFFVLQRILVIFLSEDNFAHLGRFTVGSESFNLALIFIALTNIFFIFIARKYRKPFCQAPIYKSRLITDAIKHFPIVFIIFWVIKRIIQFKTGMYFTGYGSTKELGLLSRVIEIATSPNIFLYLGIFLFPGQNKLHILGTILLLITFILSGSKAALLCFVCGLLFCYMMLVSYKIPLKYVALAGLVFALTFFYGPAAMVIRYEIISSHFHISLQDIPQLVISAYTSLTLNDLNRYCKLFLSRMGLLDWLAATIHFGRATFNTEMNFHSLFISIANSIIPSWILHNPYTDPTIFISQIYNSTIYTSVTGFSDKELVGIYGSMYIYFGYWVGILVLVGWLWYSCFFVEKYNRLFGILFIWQFVLTFMADGMFDNHVRFAVNIALYMLAYGLFRKILISSKQPYKHRSTARKSLVQSSN
jgi:hypothetical protein